jgi:hypothetical protein
MIKVNKYWLKNQLNQLLKAGKEITLDFNCGNDEAHIVPFIDGIMSEYNELYFNLEEVIFIDLNLPSAGEYMVTGKGYLTLNDDNIYLHYDLEGFMYNYDDENECENDDFEPKKDVQEKMNDSYLLLSKEYDDESKLKEFLEQKEKKDKNQTQINSNFSPSEQELWNRLKGDVNSNVNLPNKSKPWWKFW